MVSYLSSSPATSLQWIYIVYQSGDRLLFRLNIKVIANLTYITHYAERKYPISMHSQLDGITLENANSSDTNPTAVQCAYINENCPSDRVCVWYTHLHELYVSNEKWWIAVWIALHSGRTVISKPWLNLARTRYNKVRFTFAATPMLMMEKLFKSNFHFNLNVTYTRSNAYSHPHPHTRRWVNRINRS